MGNDMRGHYPGDTDSKLQVTYYDTLGVSSSATKSEIKESYKKTLLNSHPDKVGKSQTDHKISELKEAYMVLVDDSSRLRYDEKLKKLAKINGFNINGEGLDVYSLDDFEEECIDQKFRWCKDCPRCNSPRSMNLDEDALENNGTSNNEGGYDIIVQCESCSLWVKVRYYEDEDEGIEGSLF